MIIAGCILAGGKSSRMGRDKAELLLGGDTLLQNAVSRLAPQVIAISINTNNCEMSHELPILKDAIPDFAGPLAGVLAALDWATNLSPVHTHVVTIPIDAPFFPTNLVTELRNHENHKICVARCRGQLHPVFALWPISIAPILRQWLSEPKNRSVKQFILSNAHTIIDFPCSDALDPFMNINTQADLKLAEARIQQYG